MSDPARAALCDVYIDESSQNNHDFLVMGGIIVPTNDCDSFNERIHEARLPELPHGEMKWAKASRNKLRAYKRVIDLFFHPDFDSTIHFHSLVVDMTKRNDAAFNDGDSEIGFNKELFQLAAKFGRLYPYPCRFHIYPDERKTSQSLDNLRLILNRHINKREPRRDWPYRRVQFRDSKRTLCLQLTDIMTGAVAFFHNGHDKAKTASPAKIELGHHILEHAGIKNVFVDTKISGKFTIWHRQLRVVR